MVHFDRAGDTTWGQNIVQVLPNYACGGPILGRAENGDLILAVLVIKDVDEIEDSVAVYLQRINLEQELLWGENGIAVDTTSRMQAAGGVYTGPVEGTFLIYWGNNVADFRDPDPRLQLVNGDGDFIWAYGGVELDQLQTTVVTSDGCIVGVQMTVPFPTVEIIKLNSDGNQLWESRLTTLWESLTERTVCDVESDQFGGVILLYKYEKEVVVNNQSVRFFGLNAVRISEDGDSLWTSQLYERQRDERERFGEMTAELNYVGERRFFVAWADDPYSFQVIAIDIDGGELWEEPSDIITSFPMNYDQLIAQESDGGVCYFWADRDDREQGPTWQEWGQRIGLEGERLWGDRGRAVQARNVTNHSAITDGHGGAITLVEFGNNGTLQMINRNGEIGALLEVGVDKDSNVFKDSPQSLQAVHIFPNPTNSYIGIQVESDFPNDLIRLSICDLLGRTIIAEFIPYPPSIVKDLSSFPTGEYIFQLQSSRANFTTRLNIIK